MLGQFSSDYTSECRAVETQCCPGYRTPRDCEHSPLHEVQSTFTSSDGTGKTMAVFICNSSLPDYNAHIIGKENRTASVSIPPSSLFPGQIEFTQVKTFVVRWRRVKPAPLCLQREAQLHHTFHQVTLCLIKISVAKLSPLQISFIVISAAYRQIGEGLIGEKNTACVMCSSSLRNVTSCKLTWQCPGTKPLEFSSWLWKHF